MSGDIRQVTKFELAFQQFIENIKNEELDWQLEIEEEKINEVKRILVDRKITRSTKKSQLTKLLSAKTSCEKAVVGLITGCTVKISDIFGDPELDNIERPKISFSDNGYEEYIGAVELELGEQIFM